MKNQIIYELTIEDIQYVAQQELERDLTLDEINKIKNKIGDKINWYDSIADTISETIH